MKEFTLSVGEAQGLRAKVIMGDIEAYEKVLFYLKGLKEIRKFNSQKADDLFYVYQILLAAQTEGERKWRDQRTPEAVEGEEMD